MAQIGLLNVIIGDDLTNAGRLFFDAARVSTSLTSHLTHRNDSPATRSTFLQQRRNEEHFVQGASPQSTVRNRSNTTVFEILTTF